MKKLLKWAGIIIGVLIVIGVIASLGGDGEETKTAEETKEETAVEQVAEEAETEEPAEEPEVVFDVGALYGKNIDEIRAVLGEPTDGDYTDPTAQQLQLGTKEWSNTFKKDKYELLVTYDVSSKEVIDFFVPTYWYQSNDDPSGVIEKILNVENSTNFTVQSVEALGYPSEYTGVKIIPKK